MRTHLFVAVLVASTVARADDDAAPKVTTVHLTGTNDDIALEIHGASDGWQPVCVGACDRALPTGATYRITGWNVHPSEPFVIAGTRATYAVSPRLVRTTESRVGRALTIPGAILTGLGALFGIIALATASHCPSDCAFATGAVEVAGVFGGAGLVLLIPGVALLAANPSTNGPTPVIRVAQIGVHGTF